MIRATTPEHSFNLNTDASELSKIQITYTQDGVTKLTKTKSDLTIDGTWVSLTLTQEETKLFKADDDIELQIRYKTESGKVMASKVVYISVERVLNDEVL